MSTETVSYMVVRNDCTDEPRHIENVTLEELETELAYFVELGATAFTVYPLTSFMRYKLAPAKLVKVEP